jgi:hypothetical protein
MPKVTYDKKKGTKTVLDKRGKTVTDYKNKTTTTYNKKGKTIVDKRPRYGGTTVINEKGSRFKSAYKDLGKQETVKDKKGTRFYHNDKLAIETTKEGRKYYYPDGTVHLANSKGSKDITPKKETKTENKMADKKNTGNKSNTGIKPVTGKITPVSGKIEPVNYKPGNSKSSSQKPSSNKSASSSKTKQAPKKEKGFVDKANDFIDWAFRDAANKKVGEVNKSVQSKLDSTRKKVGDVNKKVQKDLDPYRKKAADLNKSVQKKLDPVRDALYGKDKKTKTSEKKVTPPISKAPVNKTPAKKDTAPKKESFNLDAEVKKTMSGAYGSGSARKEALGSNYSKVQAEINKRAAASKPKASAPKTVAKPELIKMEIKKPGKIESTGPKELQGVTPPKPAVDVDKSIDAAMEAIGKSKIMRKGGNVKSKTMNKMKTYKTGGMVNPNAKLQAGKKAGSKGVMHSLSAKAVVQKKAKGRSGGTNKPVARPKKG